MSGMYISYHHTLHQVITEIAEKIRITLKDKQFNCQTYNYVPY